MTPHGPPTSITRQRRQGSSSQRPAMMMQDTCAPTSPCCPVRVWPVKSAPPQDSRYREGEKVRRTALTRPAGTHQVLCYVCIRCTAVRTQCCTARTLYCTARALCCTVQTLCCTVRPLCCSARTLSCNAVLCCRSAALYTAHTPSAQNAQDVCLHCTLYTLLRHRGSEHKDGRPPIRGSQCVSARQTQQPAWPRPPPAAPLRFPSAAGREVATLGT